MSAFIKRYKARNGNTVIQVVVKDGRKVAKTIHIGTARTEDDLDVLISLARTEIRGQQLQLDLFPTAEDSAEMMMVRSYPQLLWETLGYVYQQLGFEVCGDEVFKQLVCARIIGRI